VLAGFEKPDRGEVSVDGEPVREPRRTGIFIFQQPSLFPWLDLEGNLVFDLNGASAEERRRLVAHYISLVGLEGFEHAFPYQLSGGMQQRAELARALMVRPEILYTDEPFGALDALTRLQVRMDLEALWLKRRPTVLFITHSVEEAVGLSDRVLVMGPSPGEVVEEIRVELPRPRPIVLGDVVEFGAYVDRIHRHFERLGVLHGADAPTLAVGTPAPAP